MQSVLLQVNSVLIFFILRVSQRVLSYEYPVEPFVELPFQVGFMFVSGRNSRPLVRDLFWKEERVGESICKF